VWLDSEEETQTTVEVVEQVASLLELAREAVQHAGEALPTKSRKAAQREAK
jgi:hypothetical protein